MSFVYIGGVGEAYKVNHPLTYDKSDLNGREKLKTDHFNFSLFDTEKAFLANVMFLSAFLKAFETLTIQKYT